MPQSIYNFLIKPNFFCSLMHRFIFWLLLLLSILFIREYFCRFHWGTLIYRIENIFRQKTKNGRDEQKNFIYIDFRIASLKLHTKKIFFRLFSSIQEHQTIPPLTRESHGKKKNIFLFLLFCKFLFVAPQKVNFFQWFQNHFRMFINIINSFLLNIIVGSSKWGMWKCL